MDAKKVVSRVIQMIVYGDEEMYLDGKYVRWGRVERLIHEAIDAELEAVAEGIEKIKQQCLESANRNDWFSNHENGEYHLGKTDAYRDVAQQLDALKEAGHD